MKLLFRQKVFSWFDSYDVFDESGNVVFRVKGELAWGHQQRIYDAWGYERGLVKERIFSFLPKFEMYADGAYIGCIRKELSFLRPRFSIECCGWDVRGDWFEWDYDIVGPGGRLVARVSKKLLSWTDTYELEIYEPGDELGVLMLAIAIDAEKCSRD